MSYELIGIAILVYGILLGLYLCFLKGASRLNNR